MLRDEDRIEVEIKQKNELKMRISVVVATYNGERFIKEQLRSLVAQTRKPDEVIISDDNSDDGTLKKLKEFKKEAPFDVKIYSNEKRLGYSRNFEEAMKRSSGNIILPCDQDDYWFTDKLDVIEKKFKKDRSTLLVFNDCEIARKDLSRTGIKKTSQIKAAGKSLRSFNSGCCTALHEALKPLIFPIPVEYVSYDGWIHRLAISLDKRSFLDRSLQLYRQHDSNTSSSFYNSVDKVSTLNTIKRYASETSLEPYRKKVKRVSLALDRISKRGKMVSRSCNDEINLEESMLNLLKEKKAAEERLKIRNTKKVKRVMQVIEMWISGGYRYFSGVKSAVKDLVV